MLSHFPLQDLNETLKFYMRHLFFSCLCSSEVWHKLMAILMEGEYTPEWGKFVDCVSDTKLPTIRFFPIRYVFRHLFTGFGKKEMRSSMGKDHVHLWLFTGLLTDLFAIVSYQSTNREIKDVILFPEVAGRNTTFSSVTLSFFRPLMPKQK